jgi:hypothetical protein
VRAADVPESLRHFLCTGCYSGGEPNDPARLSVFLLGGFVLRARVEGLRQAWADVGPVLRRQHAGPCFAERVLEAADRARDRAERVHAISAITAAVRGREHPEPRDDGQ